MFAEQFKKWLVKRVEAAGTQDAAARAIGIPQETISKIKNGRQAVTLDLLATVAETIGMPLHELVEEIEREVAPESHRRKSVRAIDEQFREEYVALFRSNPLRGRRVLANIRHQEALGLTDLISQIVRWVIDLGPADSIPKVTRALADAAEEEVRGGRRAAMRRRFAEEYRKIR